MVGEATPLMPTYHPAYLLRNPPDKNKAWSDLQQVMQKLGLKIQRR
jgi:DNA polymerase